MKVKSESEISQLCLTLRDAMDCSLPGSSAHGIFQARVPTRLAIIKKIKSVNKDGEESESSIHYWLEYVKWHSHFWKTISSSKYEV